MQPGQAADECLRAAHQIMEAMQIQEEDLIDVAYVDLLRANAIKSVGCIKYGGNKDGCMD